MSCQFLRSSLLRAHLKWKFLFALCISYCIPNVFSQNVRLTKTSDSVVMTNGILTLSLSTSGDVLGISYGGIDNIFIANPANSVGPFNSPSGGLPGDRGYYDWNGNNDATTRFYERFSGSGTMKVIVNTVYRSTISFTRKFNQTNKSHTTPADITVFYSVVSGVSGVYSWSVVDHAATHPTGGLGEFRFVMKLKPEIFVSTVLADDRRRRMAEWFDIGLNRSVGVGIKEARQIINPANPIFKYEIDHKYNYFLATRNQKAYGWIANTSQNIGIWMVNPYKDEYASGGPLKQDLTIQTAGVLLNYFHSGHAGTPYVPYTKGQKSTKVYGPWMLFFNKATRPGFDLWGDAKSAARREELQWPYAFAATATPNGVYQPKSARGSVKGKLVVVDPHLKAADIDMVNAWVGLGPPGIPGSWSYSTKEYQYWVSPSASGDFLIQNVRSNVLLNLYAYVPGVMGDYKLSQGVQLVASQVLNVGTLYFRPPRAGPTIWELGRPDRDSKEFYIPVLNPRSPYPYPSSSRNNFRNYGVWHVYNTRFPVNDIQFFVGSSVASRDWWYVQPTRLLSNGTYVGTTWTIYFKMATAPPVSTKYTLRVALAARHNSALQVRVNSRNSAPIIDTLACGCTKGDDDNAMARAASYGFYNVYAAKFSGSLLRRGTNSIYLTQRRGNSAFVMVMYDYLRLEGPTRN